MLFNSIDFAIFLPVVFLLYWFATRGSLRIQNILLLVASYFFYASWDYRFLFLLIFSTFLDYFTGIKIYEAGTRKRKKAWMWLSICINLGFLGVFKYFNFFAGSFADGLRLLGFHADFWTLQVILPVGISFYTFHGLSYVLDLYNDRISPERDYINYAVFVSFFPLLVAGPIERATHLLPQIIKKREFDYSAAVDGMQQILWGLFKKVVVADNCAPIVAQVFNNPSDHSGSELLVGVILFAFQIYGDFSGYSDIAIGTARLFGITLLRNFAFPYFARDIAEFWRRWHISLTTWFRDYLYIPIGGSRGGKWMAVRNTSIVFLVSGFWHGANWTFIAWGLLNALFFLPLLVLDRNRRNIEIAARGKLFPEWKDIAGMMATFCLTLLAWVFFRSQSITASLSFIRDIFDPSLFTRPTLKTGIIWVFIMMLLFFEWMFREKQHGLQLNGTRMHVSLKWALVMALGLVIFIFGNFNKTEFIYFAF
ncbi:MAG: MBOAT family protein [Bacteroidales bacterium]|jgi:D-alanyl-lipoteichoic acid acyltransferase DltB (MBOAT superfamily)|nr:MBOAT family protein [Bacteroidales bacterium]